MKRFLIFCFVLGFALPVNAQAIKGVYYEIYAPYSFKTPEGEIKGILIDVAETVFKELSLTVEHKTMTAWKRAQIQLASGEIDFFISVPNDERAKWSTAANLPAVNAPFNIFALKNNFTATLQKVKTKDELPLLTQNGIQITMLRGHGWAVKNLLPMVGEEGIFWLSKTDQIFKFLEKRGDQYVTFNNVPVGLKILNDLGIRDKFVIYPPLDSPALFVSGFYVMISNKSPYIKKMGELNAAIKKLTDDGTLKTIFNSWIK
jgi:ABC-type amino acid transport substrate-binding protein